MFQRYNKRGRSMPLPSEVSGNSMDGYAIRFSSNSSGMEEEVAKETMDIIEQIKAGVSVDSFNHYLPPKSLRAQITDPENNISVVGGTVSLLQKLKEIYGEKNSAEFTKRRSLG